MNALIQHEKRLNRIAAELRVLATQLEESRNIPTVIERLRDLAMLCNNPETEKY